MKKTLVAFTIVGSLILGGAAYAAIPDSGGTIHGCRNNLTHVLTVRDPAVQPSCPLLNTPLDFSAQGPQGNPGVTGPVGPGSNLYFSSQSVSLSGGDTSVSAFVACPFPDMIVSGSFGFNRSSTVPGQGETAATPPVHVNVDRALITKGQPTPNSDNYQFHATFDPFVDSGPGATWLKVTVVCSADTP